MPTPEETFVEHRERFMAACALAVTALGEDQRAMHPRAAWAVRCDLRDLQAALASLTVNVGPSSLGAATPPEEPTRGEMLAALAGIGVRWMPDEEAGKGWASWTTTTEPNGEEPADTLADALATILRAAECDGKRAAEEARK